MSYDVAVAKCAEQGMELCSESEVLARQVAGTGCIYDFTYVWTKTSATCQ